MLLDVAAAQMSERTAELLRTIGREAVLDGKSRSMRKGGRRRNGKDATGAVI
jgi:hypothetical protein